MYKNSQVTQTTARTSEGIPPIFIIGALFFIFGFITWLNGILIPFLKIACELNYTQALLVTFAFYIAYVFLALPSSVILSKTGFKNGMALGLAVMAAGAVIFIPAAYARSYPLFLVGLFVQGAGLALLQTASNPYISILGPIESAAKRISIMGIFNKVAGVISPFILGTIVLSGVDELEQNIATATSSEKGILLDALAARVIVPYLVMAIVLLILAFFTKKSSLPEINAAEEPKTLAKGTRQSIWQFPHLLLGALALFLYVGAEVIAGDTIVQYGSAQGISLEVAKNFTSFTLIAMLVGYVVGVVAIPTYMSQETALKICTILGVVFSIGVVVTSGYTSIICVALLGLANSLMWPAIFPMAIRGLGSFTATGSALLIMGIGGGAILPLVYAQLAESIGVQQAYALLIPFYLYILFYSVKGYKM